VGDEKNKKKLFRFQDLEIWKEEKDEILQDLEEECKMISGFIRSLRKG
jgi:hypothetical protein